MCNNIQQTKKSEFAQFSHTVEHIVSDRVGGNYQNKRNLDMVEGSWGGWCLNRKLDQGKL